MLLGRAPPLAPSGAPSSGRRWDWCDRCGTRQSGPCEYHLRGCVSPAILRSLNSSSATSPRPRILSRTPIFVTLDRAVCRYPNVEALLRAAAARARQRIAFTYPPDTCYARAGVVMENSWYWLKRDTFRAFLHSPERMASILEAAGFVRTARHAALHRALDLYRRIGANLGHGTGPVALPFGLARLPISDQLKIQQPLCLDIHTKCRGCTPAVETKPSLAHHTP